MPLKKVKKGLLSSLYETPEMSDFRLVWIKNKILSLLGIDDETLWTNMIVRNNNYVYKKLLHFIECNSSIDGLTSEGIFVVFKTLYPKRYTKEIFYRKIITRIKHFTRNVERKVSKSKPKKRSKKRSGQISKLTKTQPPRTTAVALNAKPVFLGIRGATHRRTKKSERSTRRKTKAPSRQSTGVETFKLAINECVKIKAHYACIKRCLMDPSYVTTEHAGSWKERDKALSNIVCPVEMLPKSPQLRGCQEISEFTGLMKINKVLLKKKILQLQSDIERSDIEHPSKYKYRKELLVTKTRLHDQMRIYSLKYVLAKDVHKIKNKYIAEWFLNIRDYVYFSWQIDPMVEFSQKPEPLKRHFLGSLKKVIKTIKRYNEIQKWNDVLLPSLDINFFNLIRKHGINRRIQIKYLKEDQSFRKMLFVSAVNWTNYINDICILIEDVDLGKDIQQLYNSSMNAYMLIWPILAQIKGASIIRNMIKILKCTNKNCYIHFLEAKKRLNLNFRYHYYTALLLQPFLDDIKTLAKCENLHLVENMWSNLNIFFSMLRIIYSTENSSFNQLTSSEESKRFSVGNVISNIYKKITPTFLRQCEKLFCQNWKLPKKDLKKLGHLCKKLTDFLNRYKEFVDNQFSNCPCVEKTEREEFAVYIDTVAEHCSRFNLMVKVLRYFEQILVIKFPSKPRMMVFQNTLKRNIRDISKQIFSLNINIFDVDPIENALLNEWFWKAIRQLSVVVIDFIDLAFDNLATSQETLKYLRYHERSNIKFFLRDKLMSKYPKIMDKYIEEAGEFQDMLVRSCPTPPRILLFPVYTNNLYYVRYIASLSYGMFRSITKEPSVANANETNQGELWKEFNVQTAANLEHFYIQQFMKKYKDYFRGNICNTKCLKIIQVKRPRHECLNKSLISKLLKKYFVPNQFVRDYDSLEEESLTENNSVKRCVENLLKFQRKMYTYELDDDIAEIPLVEESEKKEMSHFQQYHCSNMTISNYDRFINKSVLKLLTPTDTKAGVAGIVATSTSSKPNLPCYLLQSQLTHQLMLSNFLKFPLKLHFRKHLRYHVGLCKLPKIKQAATYGLFFDEVANPVRRYYLYPISNKSHRAILNEDENKTSSDVNKFLNYLQGFDKKASYPVRNKYKRFKANWWKDFFRKNPCYKLRNYEWMPYKQNESFLRNVCYDMKNLDQVHTTWTESYGDALMVELDLKFAINFDERYYTFLSEVNHLQAIGYRLPEEFNVLPQMNLIMKKLKVMTLTLMKYDHLYIDIPRHHLIMLKPFMIPIEISLRYACKSLSWGRSFSVSWTKNIDENIRKINKTNNAIEEKKKCIKDIFRDLKYQNFEFPCVVKIPKKYTIYLKIARYFHLRFIKNCQQNIAKKMIQLEWEIYGTQSGHHKHFAVFYSKIERTFKKLLVNSLLNDLNLCKQWIEGKVPSKITVGFQFDGGQILIKPKVPFLYKVISDVVFGFVNSYTHLPRWLNHSVLKVPRVLGERYISSSTYCKSLTRQKQSNWYDKLDSVHFRPRKYQIECGDYLSNWFKVITSNDNYSQEEGTFLNSLYTAPRSLLQIKNENIRKRAIKLNYKFARAPLSEDHIDYSAFNTAWQYELLPNLDRLLTIDDSNENLFISKDKLPISPDYLLDDLKDISLKNELISSDEDKEDNTNEDDREDDLDIVKSYSSPVTTQLPVQEPLYFEELLGEDGNLLPLYLHHEKLPNSEDEEVIQQSHNALSENYASDECEQIETGSRKSSTEFHPLGRFSSSDETEYSFDFANFLQDINIKAGNITEDYNSSTSDSSASYRSNRYFKDWCKMPNDVGETDLEELGLDQISHYAESEEEFDKEYYMIKKGDLNKQGQGNLMKFRSSNNKEAKGETTKMNMAVRRLHRYSYISDIIGNKKVLKTLLEIQKSVVKFFEHLNECRVRFSEVLQVVKEQESRYKQSKPTFMVSLTQIDEIDRSFLLIEQYGSSKFEGCVRLDLTSINEISWSTLEYLRLKHLHTLHSDVERVLSKYYKIIKNSLISVKIQIITIGSLQTILAAITEIQNLSKDVRYEFWKCRVKIKTIETQNLFNVTSLKKLCDIMTSLWDRAVTSARFRTYFIQNAYEVLKAKVVRLVNEFERDCLECERRYYLEGPLSEQMDWNEVMELQEKFLKQFIDIKLAKRAIDYTNEVFQLPKLEYTTLEVACEECSNIPRLSEIKLKLREFFRNYGECVWKKIDIAEAENELTEIEEAISRLPESLKQRQVCTKITKTVQNCDQLLQLILNYLRRPSVRERHWERIFAVSAQRKSDENILQLKLIELYKMRLYYLTTDIQKIVEEAELEYSLQKFMIQCTEFWSNYLFDTTDHYVEVVNEGPHGDGNVRGKRKIKRGKTISNFEPIKIALDDYLTTLQVKQTFQCAVIHCTSIIRWKDELSRCVDVINELEKTQNSLIILEQILCRNVFNKTKAIQLFMEVDAGFHKLIEDICRNPIVFKQCKKLRKSSVLTYMQNKIKNSMEIVYENLQNKRMVFPRYYFVSDEELLDILSAEYPSNIEAYISKIFINIDGFVTGEDSEGQKIIMGMISSEQEILYFGSTVDLKDSTEELMAKSLRLMKCGLKTQIMQCTYDLTNEDSPDCDVTWMRNNLGVAGLTAHFVRWTQDVEDSFKKQLDLTRLRSKVRRQFDSIQNLLRSDAISQTDRDKFVLYYLFFSQIREVFESLLQEKVTSDNDFGWIKHLRYYWDRENDSLIIKQCAAMFHYGFEYMGLNRQFVATPVTNRIYLAMTQAISKHLGSAIVGSPGVGKTETIKNLARIMGRFIMVCVCNETIEHSAIASKLTGCCMTGSWILLDKLNRLTKYVQNLITTDIQRIFGILSGKIREKDIVDVNFALFVSINIPSYGTSDFNPQLEKHLRMISYVYPDLNKICESLLCTEGFCNSENHARKIMCVFRLGQAGIIDRHYGAFNVKELVTLIKTAGSFKMQWPNVAEEAVIVSAISFTYSPKVTEDTLIPLIINHLFPEIPPVDLEDTILTEKIESVISEKQYVYVPAQVNKVCELYSLLQRHHSAIVVGPTLVGKSLIINLMTTIDGEQDVSTRRVIVNPKAFAKEELFNIKNAANEWTDGHITKSLKYVNKNPSALSRYYLIFDGQMDPSWVDNVYSLVDDKKLITLPNNQTVHLNANVLVIFETGCLEHVSPALLSRIGILNVSYADLPYVTYWTKFLLHRKDDEILNRFYDKYIPAIVDFYGDVNTNRFSSRPLKFAVRQCTLSLINQFCEMLIALLPPQMFLPQKSSEETETEEIPLEEVEEAYIIIAIFYSFGAVLMQDSQLVLDSFVKKLTGYSPFEDEHNEMAPLNTYPVRYPTFYDYYVDATHKCWRPWKNLAKPYTHLQNVCANDLFICLWSNAKTLWLLQQMKKAKRPAILLGESCSSKTATMKEFMKGQNVEERQLLSKFSYSTTAKIVSGTLRSVLSRCDERLYNVPTFICIDDLNAPKVDTYGSQEALAFLKVLIERHSTDDFTVHWRHCKNFLIFGTVTWNSETAKIDRRLLSLFSIFYTEPINKDRIEHIFNMMLKHHTSQFDQDVRNLVPELVQITSKILKVLPEKLPQVPSKMHYTFNIYEIARMADGLFLITPNLYRTSFQLFRVWRNEFLRTVSDKLINDVERRYVDELIEKEVRNLIPEELLPRVMANPIMYGDFRKTLLMSKERNYESISDYHALYDLLNIFLLQYNSTYEPLELTLIVEVMENLTKIHRVLQITEGNMILVSPRSYGKWTLTKLAAFIAGHGHFMIEGDLDYEEASFIEDIKRVLEVVGLEESSTVLFISDKNFKEGYLTVIDSLLATCSAPWIYTDRELNYIQNFFQSPNTYECWKMFVGNCRKHLHIVLGLNESIHAREELNSKVKNYSALLKCASMNWILPVKKESLIEVATITIKSEKAIPRNYKKGLARYIALIHDSSCNSYRFYNIQNNYISFKKLTEFVKHFVQLYNTVKTNVETKNHWLIRAMECYYHCMNHLLKEYGNLLMKRVINAKLAGVYLDLAKMNMALSKGIMKNIKVINETNNEIKYINELLQNFRNEVIKTTDASLNNFMKAKKDLLRISPEEFKIFRKSIGNRLVKIIKPLTLALCAVINNNSNVKWSEAQKLLGQRTFIDILRRVHPKKVSKSTLDSIKKLLEGKEVCTYTPIKGVYELFVRFLKRIIEFHEVFEEQQAILNSIRARKESLKPLYNNKTLRVETADMKCKLQRNLKLMPMILSIINGIKTDIPQKRSYVSEVTKLFVFLRDEFQRWQEKYKKLIFKRSTSIGTSLLLSAFINYLGPLVGHARRKLLYRWQRVSRIFHIPMSKKKIDLLKWLVEAWELRFWHENGLKTDEVSIQNAVLTMKTDKCPLIIDPEKQFNYFLRRMATSANCKFYEISIDNPEFKKVMKEAIKMGATVFVTDVYSISKTLESLINKNVIIDYHGTQVIQFDGENILFDENFKIFLSCGLNYKSIDPALYHKTTVINSDVHLENLISQLNTLIYSVEFPAYEQLLLEFRQRISYLGTQLEKLSTLMYKDFWLIRDNFLDNSRIKVMNRLIHIEYTMIQTELKKVLNEQVLILEDKKRYKVVAIKLAILYRSLNNASVINPLYVPSLDKFTDIIELAVTIPHRNENEVVGPHKMVDLLPKAVFKYVIAGFLNKDKFFFLFYLTTRWQLYDQCVTPVKISYIMRGGTAFVPEVAPETSRTPWLSKKVWTDVAQLVAEFPNDFKELTDQLTNPEYSARWKMWYESERPEIGDTPCELYNDYYSFRKLLLIRCLRKDRLYPAMVIYVELVAGKSYLDENFLNFKQIYLWNMRNGPVLFIQHNNATITNRLLDHAQKCGRETNLISFTIGQTSNKKIIEAYRHAIELEAWFIIKDCHLWTDQLNEILEINSQLHQVHDEKYTNHRLWLIAFNTTDIPQDLLRRSVKVVIQKQRFLRDVMDEAMSALDKDYIQSCGYKHFGLVLYALTFVHGVFNIRSKYGKLCWNVSYDFGENLYKLCAEFIANYMLSLTNLSESCINWDYVKYTIGEVFYGGQTIDYYDYVSIKMYVDEFFDDHLVLKNHMLWDQNLCKFKFEANDDYNISDYLEEIKKIPLDDAPELLGLQNSASGYYYLEESKYLSEAYTKIHAQCEPAVDIVKKHGDILKRLTSSIKLKITSTFDIHQSENEEANKDVSRIDKIFLQELIGFNKLLTLMVKDIDNLSKELNEGIALSEEMTTLAHTLCNGAIPVQWREHSPQTEMNLAQWINHFSLRAKQYKNYILDGVPSVVWLSGLQYPRACIIAILMESCKRKNFDLSSISFYTEVIDMKKIHQVYFPSKEEFHISGLYLQNASWDDSQKCIVEPTKFYPLTELIPLIKIVPFKRSVNHNAVLTNKVVVPVYTTPRRRNVSDGSGVVFDATLPKNEQAGKWTLYGLCLLLNSD
ncbi:dynein axonemal heavy chain 10-like isoform X4 [Rhodnius prolixus]|uniref:dynein axonemal heavy chain 10-like isoform X4 n=1 Tax=Rhodnius prolixus TaxID=13249 RepID=UPI003D18C830